jgi:hypothetical protein
MTVFTEKEIPRELWNNNILYVPQQLADLYEEILKLNGVYNEALKDYHVGKNYFGGLTDKETIEHFQARYLASSTRVQYLVLNPQGEFTNIQIDTLSILSDGQINILNIPCGTGSDILSLLVMLLVLRGSKLIPTTPLNIRITAGDISTKALEIYGQFLDRAKPIVKQQGIEVEWAKFEWDATRDNTTALVMDHLLDLNSTSKEYLVLICAFSGAGKKLFNEFEFSLRQIESRLDSKRSTTLWIEPKEGKDGFLFRAGNLYNKISGWLKKEEKTVTDTTFSWCHPFTKKIIQGTMSVRKYSKPK